MTPDRDLQVAPDGRIRAPIASKSALYSGLGGHDQFVFPGVISVSTVRRSPGSGARSQQTSLVLNCAQVQFDGAAKLEVDLWNYEDDEQLRRLLGGRYCLHFWRLLSDLDIPFATLLDFDIGRQHEGAGTIRSVVEKLGEIDVDLSEVQAVIDCDIDPDNVDELTDEDIWLDYDDNMWVQALEEVGVFLSDPLDLDFAMLEAFPDEYQVVSPGGRGPGTADTALENAKKRTLKERGDATLYGSDFDDSFRWYSYLFIQRSKPETHIAALSRISDEDLAANAPHALRSLIEHVRDKLGLGS